MVKRFLFESVLFEQLGCMTGWFENIKQTQIGRQKNDTHIVVSK